jgi:N-acetylmuramoyl-L-alanine amidase
MKTRNLKMPLTLAFLACFVVVALTANNRAGSVPAAAGINDGGRRVIVLDAGHGGLKYTTYMVNIIPRMER